METKQSIRTKILKVRNEMSHEEHKEKSTRIANALFSCLEWKEARLVLLYRDYKNEVATEEIFLQGLYEGKQIAFPKITGTDMEFYYVESLNQLKEGYKGIFEPENCEMADLTHYQKKEILMLLPGSAFDRKGNRIGYGKGFYDRYISHKPEMNKLALAFDFQIVEEIPTDVFDIPVDKIVTNTEII